MKAAETAPIILWKGRAADASWTLTLVRVYDGPAIDPATGETLAGSHSMVWSMTLASDRAEILDVWWSPADRILGGAPLAGWSTHVIGQLKRHLVGMGVEPRSV